MTSFPPRIPHIAAALDGVLRQTYAPRAVVLALADEEFPGRRLPRHLRRLERRGVTVVWTARNGRSFDKLLPVLRLHPDARIVTVDDDKWYRPTFLAELVAASDRRPGTIVGHYGLAMEGQDGRLEYREGWTIAGPDTPAQRVFLIGASGILYPPGSLAPQVTDLDLAERLCPHGDDHWFFAMGRLAGSPSHCLGTSKPRSVGALEGSPSLSEINGNGMNEVQFRAVVEHFGLRDAVLGPSR